MMRVEPSFVLYALDLGCCLRAHTVLSETVEPVEPEKKITKNKKLQQQQ